MGVHLGEFWGVGGWCGWGWAAVAGLDGFWGGVGGGGDLEGHAVHSDHSGLWLVVEV
jgi:hypothetical protein